MERPQSDDDYYELMRSERSRLNTFYDYPDDAAISPVSHAAAGFFYTGRETRVECAFCRGSIKDFTGADDPVTVHRVRFPHCQFIQQHNPSQKFEETKSADLTQPSSNNFCQSQSSDDEPKCFRDCLVQRKDVIVQKLQHVDDIVEHLVDDSISAISQDQCEVILSESKEQIKVRKLLDTLHQCGEEAVKSFMVALHFTDQHSVCEFPLSLNLDLPSQPLEILSSDKFKTLLKQKYKKDIEEKNRLERELFGHVVSLEQHEPVVITHGKKCPDEHLRKGFNEFLINESDKQVISLRDVFKASPNQKRDHSILLLGGPGSGKTSLCFTILYHYIQKHWLDEHQIVVFTTLKALEGLPDLNVKELLFRYGGVHMPASKEHRVMEQLEKRQSTMLLMFDGYDEVKHFLTDDPIAITDFNTKAKPLTLVANIINGNLFPESHVLITSRPHDMQHVKTNLVCELVGLTKVSIDSLMAQVVPSNLFDAMISYLNENSDIYSLVSMPVNLQNFLSYISWLAEYPEDIEDFQSFFPKTKSAVYSSQIYPMLKQCLRLKGIVHLGRKKMWREPFVKMHLSKLCKLADLALKKLGERQILFSEDDLEDCGLSDQEVKVSGFMTSFVQKRRTSYGVESLLLYYFTHSMNLEWVCGLRVIDSSEKLAEIISHNRGQFDVIVCFVAGLLRSSDSQQMIESIFGLSNEECEQMSVEMFYRISSSERCKMPGGHQFAIEVFFEGQFVDATLLVHLLSPQQGVLEIAGISLVNKAAIRYFFSKLSASYSDHSHPTNDAIYHLKLDFGPGADIAVIRDMIGEAISLQQLRTIEFPNAGLLHLDEQSSSPMLTSAAFVVNHDARANTRRRIFRGICGLESFHLLHIYRSEEQESAEQYPSSGTYKIGQVVLNEAIAANIESDDIAQLELCHTEDREGAGTILDCLISVDHVKHIEVKDAESPVMLWEKTDDPLQGTYHVTILDRAPYWLIYECLRLSDSGDCIYLKKADDEQGVTLCIKLTKDSIHALPCGKQRLYDSDTLRTSPSQTEDDSRLTQAQIHHVLSCNPAKKNSILVDMNKLQTSEVGRAISEFSQTRQLELLLLKGEMDDETVDELLSTTSTTALCLVNTTAGRPRHLSSTTKRVLKEIHVFPACYLPRDSSSFPSTLCALSLLWYDDRTAKQVNEIIRRSPSLVALGLLLVKVENTRALMKALSALPMLDCLILDLVHDNPDIVCDLLRRLTLSELWLTFWSSPCDDDLRKLSFAVNQSQNLQAISLFGCDDITPFFKGVTAPHLKKVYIKRGIKLNTRSQDGFTGEIISVDDDLCPLINSNNLLSNHPLAKQILKARFVKPCMLNSAKPSQNKYSPEEISLYELGMSCEEGVSREVRNPNFLCNRCLIM